jgi:hypothetical protein
MPASIPAFDEKAQLTDGTLFVEGDLVIPNGAASEAAQITAIVVQNEEVALGQGSPDGDRWRGSVDGSKLSAGPATAVGTLVVPSGDGTGTWTFTWTVPITIEVGTSGVVNNGGAAAPELQTLVTELLRRVLGDGPNGTASSPGRRLGARESGYQKPSAPRK